MGEDISRRAFLGAAAGGLAALVEGCHMAQTGPLDEANVLIDQKEYRQAIELLSNVIKENPTPQAYNLRGIAYLKRGYDDKAIDDFGETIRRDSCNSVAFKNKGYAYCKKALRHRVQGEGTIAEAYLEQSLQDMQFAVRYAPQDPQAHAYLGMVYGHQFESDKEFFALDKAMELLSDELKPLSEEQRAPRLKMPWVIETVERYNQMIQLPQYRSRQRRYL